MSNVANINGAAISEIADKLRQKGAAIERAAKQALREGAAEIVQAAKLNCPVKTGKLRDSIRAEIENGGITYKITADAKNEKGIPYGKIVEYSPRINRPFLFPAIESNLTPLNNKIKEALKAER